MKSDKPTPSESDRENEAREIIDSLLSFMLNRHVHKLSEYGYLDKTKYDRDYGYEEHCPKEALRMKLELIEEAKEKFRQPLSKKIRGMP